MNTNQTLKTITELDDLEFAILNSDDINYLIDMAENTLPQMQDNLGTLMKTIAIEYDLEYALLDLLEALDAKLSGLIGDCYKYARLIESEQEQEEEYGTYDDQVRDQYYGEKL